MTASDIRALSFEMKNVKRSAGQSCIGVFSYIAAVVAPDTRTGELVDNVTDPHRVVHVATLLPEGAPSTYVDPVALFNAIENTEKAKDSMPGKTMRLALPNECSAEQHIRMVEDFIRENICANGYAATYAIHSNEHEKRSSKPLNIHAHILVANRPIRPDGTWGAKRKTAYALDENGQKIPVLVKDRKTGKLIQKVERKTGRKLWERVDERHWIDRRESLLELRSACADVLNRFVDQDRPFTELSYLDLGITQLPTIHEGQSAQRRAAEGLPTERVAYNDAVRTINSDMELMLQLRDAAHMRAIQLAATRSAMETTKPKKKKRMTLADLAPLELKPRIGGARFTVSPERQGTRDAVTLEKPIKPNRSESKRIKATDKTTATKPRKTAQNPAQHTPQTVHATPHEPPQKSMTPRTDIAQTPQHVAPVVQTPPPAQTPQPPRRIGYDRLVAAGEVYAQTGEGLHAVLTTCVQRPDLSPNNVLAVVGARHLGAIPVIRVATRYADNTTDRLKPPRRRTVQLSPSSPLPLIPAGATDAVRDAIRAEVGAGLHTAQTPFTTYMIPQIQRAVLGDALHDRRLERAAQILAADCTAHPDAHPVRSAVRAIVGAVRHLITTVRTRIRRRTQTQTQGQSQVRTAEKRAGKTTGQTR